MGELLSSKAVECVVVEPPVPLGTKRIFIVMPAYQAAGSVGQVLGRIPLGVRERLTSLIVVNDGSSDHTEGVVREWMGRWRQIRLINQSMNLGYAMAQKTGFKAALAQGADIVALLHADGQYAPELLPTLLKPLEDDEADVVQGSRILGGGALKGGMPLYKYIANRALSAIENFAYGLDFAEYHSGYMLYSRKALEAIPFERLSNTFHFDGEMLLMASKRRLRVKELPIPTCYAGEQSHLKPIKYGFDVLGIIVKNALGGYKF